MKTYDYIKSLLESNPELRNSDMKLIWHICKDLGYVTNNAITFENFNHPDFPNFETIRRTRQKIQENFPDLQASEAVQFERKKKQSTKSTFVYREEVQPQSWEVPMERYQGKDGRYYWREVNQNGIA